MTKAAVISEKGMRQEMEDAHSLDLNFSGKGWVFAGVYDGHNENFAAEYSAKRLPQLFLEKLLYSSSTQEAFIKSYKMVSEELKNQESGTTVVTIFIMEDRIFSANAGDARAIVIGNQKIHQLTVDHRLDNPEERQRIEKMGGMVVYPYTYRGSQGIMPTRTIGDEYFKPVGVIATPSVNEYTVSEDDFITILACDGLFDFMTNEEVADFAREHPEPKPLVEALKHEVLENRLGTDNLTIIGIALK